MADLKLEYLDKLTSERREDPLNRSKTDVTDVLEDVRKILTALRRDGDAESLRWHRQYKGDITVLVRGTQSGCAGGRGAIHKGTFGMRDIWVVDDDEEMSRAVGRDAETTGLRRNHVS